MIPSPFLRNPAVPDTTHSDLSCNPYAGNQVFLAIAGRVGRAYKGPSIVGSRDYHREPSLQKLTVAKIGQAELIMCAPCQS